ncbi:hypothetical protein MC28_A04 (plasmid) [Bacillus thuringiensis MC28]|nr:hypothetical protein MC28_A04 [Bacillus thuringiensis MC28]
MVERPTHNTRENSDQRRGYIFSISYVIISISILSHFQKIV